MTYLFDFNFDGASIDEAGSADSAELDDSGLVTGAVDDEPIRDEGSMGSGDKRRRKRGSCGGSSAGDKDGKWRSGAVPATESLLP